MRATKGFNVGIEFEKFQGLTKKDKVAFFCATPSRVENVFLESRGAHLRGIKERALRPWLRERCCERSPSFEKKLGPELIVKI